MKPTCRPILVGFLIYQKSLGKYCMTLQSPLKRFKELLERVTRRADVAADIFRGLEWSQFCWWTWDIRAKTRWPNIGTNLGRMFITSHNHTSRWSKSQCVQFFFWLQGFVDLGSGRGHAVLVAHALFPFRQCVGHGAYAVSQGMFELLQIQIFRSFRFAPRYILIWA